jgi:hypothetical protein
MRQLTTATVILWLIQPAPAPPVSAAPREPVAAMLEALRTNDVVALDEGAHRNEQGHAIRLALVRHPRFPDLVNDIVVEFGTAAQQPLIDRFVGGEEVPAEALRAVWQDTTQHDVWDVPIYAEFFRAVRIVNASRPRERRLRVLLADPPIAWAAVRNPPDHFRWLQQRDTFAAGLVEREVLAKGRRALLIFGGIHLQRRHIAANYEAMDGADTLVSLLARKPSTRLFVIMTPTTVDLDKMQPDVAGWPIPSIIRLKGTQLGATDFGDFMPSETLRFAIRDGKPAPIPKAAWRRLRMEEQADALLYLGPRSRLTFSRRPLSLCDDRDYVGMRQQRLRLLGLGARADGFAEACRSESR